MNDHELVKKIKLLKKIEPSSDWAGLTKRQLLGAEEPTPSWFMAHWQPALAGLLLSLVMVGGLLGLIRFSQEDPLLVDQDDEPVAIVQSGPLSGLEESLFSLKDQIINLKDQIAVQESQPSVAGAKSYQVEEIQAVIESIRALTQNIEEIDRDRVLASLNDEIEEAGEEMQMAFLESELNDLREQADQGLMSEEKMLGLAEVEELYQNEDYENAFWRLIELVN